MRKGPAPGADSISIGARVDDRYAPTALTRESLAGRSFSPAGLDCH
ncbi:MAG: hypothetical protein WBD93_01140 [Acidobacteriaceae bacterium]